MFLPINLCSEYLFVEKTVSIYYLLLCFIITLFLIHILNKHLLPTQRTKILFFFGWFFISFGPFYNIFLPLTATLRPHWLYFPGIGFLSGTIFIISYFFKKTNSKLIKFSIKTFILIWILALTVLTIQRNSQWHDPIILYSHDVKLEPKSFTLYNNLGVEYFRKGEINKAKECFLKSIETSPENRYDVAWNNIGVIYENENQPHLAINAYKKSIELGNYKLAFSNLGRLYLKLGKINDAVLILQQGKKFYPYDEEINYYLSLINQSFQTVNFN
jgi:tetratricopeptide (TPR) repeat protein